MARGPRRKPADIEKKQGNPGRRSKKARAAIAAIADEAPADISQPPADLDEIARPYWASAAAYLSDRGLLKGVEPDTLARYCEYYAMWRAMRSELRDGRRKSGLRLIYETNTKHGTMQRLRPQFRAMMECERELRNISDRFGLTPSTRAALMTRLAEARDPKSPPMARAPGAATSQATNGADDRALPPAPASPIGTLGKPRYN